MIEDFNELAKGLVKRHENLLLELRNAARNLGVEPPERPESDVTVDEIQEQFQLVLDNYEERFLRREDGWRSGIRRAAGILQDTFDGR